MGFGVSHKSGKSQMSHKGTLLSKVQPEDLLKFGLIPEFVGRLPMVATLEELNEADLLRVLQEPKNALIKQYRKLFEMENVQLRFAEGSLQAIARQALERKVGARGLRAILESTMLDLMYEIPSDPEIKEIVVSEETILKNERPLVVYHHKAESA